MWFKRVRRTRIGGQALAPSHPGRALILVFLIPILVGGLLLRLPLSARDGVLDWSAAYFTATSAVCVTGLTVTDTGTSFSLFGQFVILSLIQIGGLGYMVASSLLLLIFRREPTLHERLMLKDSLGTLTLKETSELVWRAVRFTLAMELTGAVILTARFLLEPGHTVFMALWRGLFHSISAFCNAGFDILGPGEHGGSLSGFRDDPVVNFTVMALIVIGGLGFIVCQEMMPPRRRRLSLHSRVVLTMTFLLIVLGTLSFLATEWTNVHTLGPLSVPQKLLASLFQAVTFRTAGFYTLDFGEMRSITLLIGGILMFIGASPGGTGGGIKTTTFAVMLVAVKAALRGDRDAEVFNRRLDADLVYRALTMIFVAFAVIVAAMFILTFTEPTPSIAVGEKENLFVKIQFEVLSAFGTGGLTTGITPHFTEFGRLVVMALMFLGRLGPTTVAVAFAHRFTARKYRLPEEKVALG